MRTKEYIEELGKKLYTKITEIIKYEVNDISEEDCINYMVQLVIDRTYEGYKTEIDTIYGQLENILSLKIKPLHLFVSFYDVSSGVSFWVPNVESSPGGIRKHIKYIVFWF